MAKQLNVNLAFTADTKQAKAQIQQLQQSLDGLLSSSIKDTALTGFDQSVSNAQQSVLKLKTAINNSLNADTGRLDLSKFNQQLNSADLSLSKLATDISGLGADGQKAFLNLANSIVTAQKPMMESNKLLDGMWTALKNTARWQLSSSILHGFMGALQGAYGYAQDLNRSLTDIAIVTGNSVDNMAAFADQANKSAQALSTSTLAYTDAALIYYQAGFNDEEVRKRTETTLKMSNVTRDSAEEVSSYMMAIWNNFYDGSQSIESFADKITALGAATASSSAEIAEGLGQFASLGSSLGLNYDDAVAALATVVAQTRQSASTVGNSFRTLLQRFESLSLGDTLDDGVNLTKYSKALAAVGVQVLDVNGDRRDMSDVIQDLGEKWQTLSTAQRNAFAQTVGGVRNSNTLIAWMNNFDKFQENLQIAASSEGALQQQQDTYAESWEAAAKRVKAAWQSIYQDLIDDKFFITILNGIEKILQGVDGLIDSIGGLPGVLSAVSVVLTSVFGDKLVQSLDTGIQQIRVFSGVAKAENDALVAETKQLLEELRPKGDIDQSVESLEIDAQRQRLDLVIELREVYDQLTDSQKEYANNLLESVERQQQLTIEAKRTEEAARQSQVEAMRALRNSEISADNGSKLSSFLNQYRQESGAFGGDSTQFERGINKILEATAGTKKWNEAYDSLYRSMLKASDGSKEQAKLIENLINKTLQVAEAKKNFQTAQEVSDKEVENFNGRLQELVHNHQNGVTSTQELIEALEREKEKFSETSNEAKKLQEQIDKLKQSNQGIFGVNFSQDVISAFRGISQLTLGINSLRSAFEALNNQDLSALEKITKFASGVSIGAPALLGGGSKALDIGKNIYNSIYSYFGQKAANKGTALYNIGDIYNNLLGQLNGVYGEEAEQISGKLLKLDDAYQKLSNNINISTQELKNLGVVMLGNLHWWEDLGAVISGVATKIGAFLVEAAPVIATIATIAGAIYVAKEAYKSFYAMTTEGQLEAANEKLEEQKNKVEELKTTYNDLKSTLEEYKSVQESLGELEGYDRVEAVNEENQKILELIKNTDNWKKILESGGLKYDQYGLIELTEKQQEALLNDQERELSLQRQIYYQDQLNQLQAQNNKDYKDTYSGKEIKITRQAGTQTIQAGGEDREFPIYETINLTRDVAQAMNELGMTIEQLQQNRGNEQNELKDQLEINGVATGEELDTIIDVLMQIAGTENGRFEFAELQQNQAAFDAQYGATKTEQSRSQWTDYLGEDFGLFTSESQQLLLDGLSESGESLDKLVTDGKSFDEILKELGIDAQELALQVQQIEFDRAIDEDIDADELETFGDFVEQNADKIQGLSAELVGLEKESNRVAESILRFDDAIQDVTDNYDDWMHALKNGTAQDQAKAMKEIADAYTDLLDLGENDALSANFLENAENLNLMKAAIEGDEEAYNRLREAAMKDIVTNLFLNDQNAINQAYALNDELQNAIQDLEIGAEIDPVAMAGLYDQMNAIINAADMTASQASDLLASMGVDATIEEVQVKKPKNEELIDVVPTIDSSAGNINVPIVAADGSVDYQNIPVEGIKMEARHHQEEGSSTETITALRVTSARKSSGGGFKFNNSTHGGGSKGSTNKGKSSGGGGGSSKKPEVKEHKDNIKEGDRYHDIKERISDLNTELTRLGKTKDRVYGKSKLKYIDDEIKKTEEQIELTKEYIGEIERYLKIDQGALKGIDMGAVFDDNGMLTNYEQVLLNIGQTYNDAINAYNKAVDTYNASAQGDAEKETLEQAEKKLKEAEKLYNENKEILKQYETTYNLLQEQNEELMDQLNDLYDKELQKITWQVELQLEFDEADRKFLEWLFNNLGDSADFAADKIANLSKQIGTLEKDLDAYRDGLQGIFALHGIDLDVDSMSADDLVSSLQDYMRSAGLASELTEDDASAIRDYLDALMDTYDSMKDIMDQVHDTVIEASDEQLERLERETNQYDLLNKKMEYYLNIIDLTGKHILKMNSNNIRKVYQTMVDNAQNQVASSRKILDELQVETARAKENMERFLADGDTQSYNYWKEIYEDFEDKTNDAMETWMSDWENALQKNEEAFKKSMELMVEDYKNSLGTVDLDFLSDEFARQRELQDLYLPDYKKYHELNQSAKDLNKSLANTNNTLVKGKMNDLMDEINQKMRDGVQVSEYETEIIARRVALLQAEAELENARNAKSAVRMTRDNEGNFSYTYTADPDKIGDAQETYAEKFYELLDYERKSQDEIQGQMIQKQQEFIDQITDINEKYKDDEAARIEALKQLAADYEMWLEFYADQDQILMNEMGRLRDDDWQDVERITGLKLANNEDFISQWENTIYGRLEPGYESAAAALDAWKDEEKVTLDQANNDVRTWQQNNQKTYRDAGEDVDTFKDTVQDDLKNIQDESEKTRAAVEDMVDNPDNGMKTKMDEAITAAENLDTAYGKVMESIRNQITTTVSTLNEMLTKLNQTYTEQKKVAEQAEATARAVAAANAAAANQTTGPGGGSPADTGGGYVAGTDNKVAAEPNERKATTVTRTVYFLTSTGQEYNTIGEATSKGSLYGGSLYRRTYIGTKLTSNQYIQSFSAAAKASGGSLGSKAGVSFASGGYTGDWGSTDGRIAMLHQKELILNEDDTKNFLSAIDIVRGIADKLSLNNSINANINYNTLAGVGAGGELQQQVHIDASFPNVQSHSEIELALNNLVNSATQYVNRK